MSTCLTEASLESQGEARAENWVTGKQTKVLEWHLQQGRPRLERLELCASSGDPNAACRILTAEQAG